jgi:hypothetical protein
LATTDALHLYSYPQLDPLAVYVMPFALSLQALHALPNNQWTVVYEDQVAVLDFDGSDFQVLDGSILELQLDPIIEPRLHKHERFASATFGPELILAFYPDKRALLVKWNETEQQWSHASVWETENGCLSLSAWAHQDPFEASRAVAISGTFKTDKLFDA